MKKLLIYLLLMNAVGSGNGQVQLQTGSATFNLPMFNWQDDKSRLNAVVALSYSSGNGLKVNDMASCIGQGWGLVAGGVITRVQVGEPDDQPAYDASGTIEDIYKYPAGYLYNPADASQGCPTALAYYPIFGDQDHLYKNSNAVTADREQDYFSFEFNGRTGLFVLGKNNGDQGITLGDSKLKISFQRNPALAAGYNSRTVITSFTIQDENGLIYTFSRIGFKKILRMIPSPTYPTYVQGGVYDEIASDLMPLSSKPYIITDWYLTKVQDPLTLRQINVNYSDLSFQNRAGEDLRYVSDFGSGSSSGMSLKEYIQIYHNVSIAKKPSISSIQYPDGHIVSFNYDAATRVDLPGDYPLKSVDIQYNGRTSSRYVLNTTYFILNKLGTPATIDQRMEARLCLKSVQRIGVDLKEEEPPYIFDYYTGSNDYEDFVPPPFYYIKDVWGYYNGSNVDLADVNTSAMPILTTQLHDMNEQLRGLGFAQLMKLCFVARFPIQAGGVSYNTIKKDYAKNGLLKMIKYPAGATLSYEYEQNIYNWVSGVNTVVRSGVNSSTYTGGVHVAKTTKNDGGYSNGDNAPINTVYKYTDESGTLTSQWGGVRANNIYNLNNTLALEGSHHPILGGCKYDYQYPGIQSLESAVIITSDAPSAITVYGLMSQLDPTGALAVIDLLKDIVQYLTTSCTGVFFTDNTYVYANQNLAENRGYPTHFSRVEVSSDAGSGGKIVHEFTDFNDYPLWDISDGDKSWMKQNYAVWAYGLPKKISVYNQNGALIRQTENSYNWSNAKRNASADVSCHCDITAMKSMRNDNWSSYSSAQNLTYTTASYNSSDGAVLNAKPYSMQTGRAVLSDTYERVFKPTDVNQFSETHTQYEYNSNNYQANRITTTQSNGDKAIKEVYYPLDYSISTNLLPLYTHNIINVPVAVYNSVQKNGSADKVTLSASVTDFSVISNGDIKPARVLVSRIPDHVTGFSFDPVNPFNYPGLTVAGSFGYNSSGNLIRTQDEGGRVLTNIYDYDDKLITAVVVNADPYLDRVAYTSFETTDLGGWTVNGVPVYDYAHIVTGARGFVLNDATPAPLVSIGSNININKPFVLSFWSVGSINVSGANLRKSGPVINGFTYYEYDVAPGAHPQLTGQATIDELRLYPANARMHTTTYDPLIGKTSECDESSHVIYYEYDNLGRLRIVRDEKRNIVKMYEYNFKK